MKFLKILRLLMLILILLCVLIFSFIWYTNYVASRAGNGLLFDKVSDVPHTQVALVFGTSERLRHGNKNLYFKYRIQAAAELWQAKKVDHIIVSGDNSEKYYNEPVSMRSALVQKGVPFDKIICDYAGFRTLDSVIRAKEVFGLKEVIFVSQKFQNERAAYIAKAHNMKVLGYNAQDLKGTAGRKTKLREILARVQMWFDVNIINRQPKFLGEKIDMPE